MGWELEFRADDGDTREFGLGGVVVPRRTTGHRDPEWATQPQQWGALTYNGIARKGDQDKQHSYVVGNDRVNPYSNESWPAIVLRVCVRDRTGVRERRA